MCCYPDRPSLGVMSLDQERKWIVVLDGSVVIGL